MTGFYQGKNWIEQLPEPLKRDIRSRMRRRVLMPGERLYEKGGSATALYEVHHGFLKLQSTGRTGAEILITIYGPGSCLGEIPLITQRYQARVFDAVAQGEVEVSVLPQAEFELLTNNHAEISDLLMNSLCQTIVGLLARIEDTALLSLKQRLANLFYSASKVYGETDSQGVVIKVPLTQADMGSMLGVTRQSVQRELRHWSKSGWVDKTEGFWRIRNTEALMKL